MRSGRGAVRAFDPAGLDLGSGDGAEETEIGAGISDMAERADECRFFSPPAEVFGGGKENKFARA